MSLGLIICPMCSHNNLHALCSLPYWIWCLSACSMVLVSIVFAVCEWVGIFAFFFLLWIDPVCFLVVSVWVILLEMCESGACDYWQVVWTQWGFVAPKCVVVKCWRYIYNVRWCWSIMFGNLVGVFNVMWSELLWC